MKIKLRKIDGNWDLGYALDKHTVGSIFIGNDAMNHPQFDTERTEVGESLYKLKYRSEWGQLESLAQQLAISIYPQFKSVDLIVPMPPSNIRSKQPVIELAKSLSKLVNVPVFENILTKKSDGKQLKNLNTKDEKLEALRDSFSLNDGIQGDGPWNALLIDDLYATGASMQEACKTLRTYPKIGKIYVATLTWK